jgi:hypothetical protein
MKMDFVGLIIIIFGFLMLVGGIRGVVNRKRIRNVAHFILSISEIMCGVIGLAVVVLFYLTDWGEKLREVLMQ